MNPTITELTQKAAAQATEIPALYGRVDFSITPERFAAKQGDQSELAPEFAGRRAAI